MNNFYVYLHKDNNDVVFYVGKGRRERAFSKTGRSKKWKQVSSSGYSVEIVENNLSEESAIHLEKQYITKYKNTIVNHLDNAAVLNLDYESVSNQLVASDESPSGLFWKKNNKIAGCLNKRTGYYVVRVDNKLYQAHRIVWLLHNKEISADLVIDHIDNNRTNNKIENLRLIQKKINNFNRNKSYLSGIETKIHKNCTTFIVYFRINGKRVRKSFSTKDFGESAQEMAVQYRNKINKELYAISI